MKLKVLANLFESSSNDLQGLSKTLEEDIDAEQVKETIIKEILVRQLPRDVRNTARTFDPLNLEAFTVKMDQIKKKASCGRYEIIRFDHFVEAIHCTVEQNTLVRQGNLVYSFGGSINNDHGNKHLNILDLETKTWRNVKTSDPWPEKRLKHAACSQGDSMFVFGGVQGKDEVLLQNDLWELDLKTESWSIVSISSYKPRPAPRKGHGIVVHENILYLFGGVGCGDMWMVDLELQEKVWTRVYFEGDMPQVVRDNYSLVNGFLWVKELDILHKYDFETMTWSEVDTSLGELGCSMASMAPNKLHFFGNPKSAEARDNSSTIKIYDTLTGEEDFLLIANDVNVQFFEQGSKTPLENSFLAFGGSYDGHREITQSIFEIREKA